MSAQNEFRRLISFVLLWFVSFNICVAIIGADKGFNICSVEECNCDTNSVTVWIKNITCILHKTQVLTVKITDIPCETTQIFINGGKEVKFSEKAFNSMPGLISIHIEETKKIIMERQSFFEIHSPSLLVTYKNCEDLIIKTGSFENVQSSVSIEVVNIHFVTVEQEAFSKLFNGTFKFIEKILLSEGSFDFKNQGSIGRHGPVTIILFDNVYIPTIPKEAFLTSLASLSFHNCKIDDVYTESFKAAEISSVSIINTSIHFIHERAFTDRTLICELTVSKCNISKLHSDAIMAAIGNLTLNHSSIMEIDSRAVVTTVANVEIRENYIGNFHTSGFIFNNWNKITFDNNILINLHANFVEAPINSDTEIFSLKGNELYEVHPSALNYISRLGNKMIFHNNFFNKTCSCTMLKWLEKLTNSIKKAKYIMTTSYCPINKVLSQCFSLSEDVINMEDFMSNACNNITCVTLNDERKKFNKTFKTFLRTEETGEWEWLIFLLITIGIFFIILISLSAFLIIKGVKWIKRNIYFRNTQNDINLNENQEGHTRNQNEKLEIPEELTMEFLQVLSKRLDNAETHQEASQMIERLYEMFIIDDNYENNNRQDEETHLYEELGNLSLQIPPPPYEEELPVDNNTPKSILKLMEEKFYSKNGANEKQNMKPTFTEDYSIPTDAEKHIYTELKNYNEKTNEEFTATGSKDALMLLPHLPDQNIIFKAGPSSRK